MSDDAHENWSKLRDAVMAVDGSGGTSTRLVSSRNVTLLSSLSAVLRRCRSSLAVDAIPEEGGDLHEHFRTCSSLTRIREEFRGAVERDIGAEIEGIDEISRDGGNACACPEEGTGRLLLHSIGLNSGLITSSSGGGGTAAFSRINHFVLNELLSVYPAAIVQEDANGNIPFMEPIVQWIRARRAIRKWNVDTDATRRTVALLASSLQNKVGVTAARRESESPASDSDSVNSHSTAGYSTMRSIRYWFTAGRAVKEARKQLRKIVESSSDSIICINEKGVIILCNKAVAEQFGYTMDELHGSNIARLCNKRDSLRHDSYLQQYMETGVKKVIGKKRELLARRKDGSTFLIELGLTEVELGRGKSIFCGFVKDITEVISMRKLVSFESSNLEGDGKSTPPLVEYCFAILSEYIDNYGQSGERVKNGGGKSPDVDGSDSDVSDLYASFTGSDGDKHQNSSDLYENTFRDEKIVEKIASIPHLLEELLLISDTKARSRIFDMSIMHKILFNKDSLGDGQWLIDMLDKSIRIETRQQLDANLAALSIDTNEGRAYRVQLQMAQEERRFLAEAAIFYFERVSTLNISDDMFVFHHLAVADGDGLADKISNSDADHFRQNRNALFDKIGNLNGLIRRVCVLGEGLVKRAAATTVIRRKLDKVMFSPFAVVSALFDLINHVLLIIAFRQGPATALFCLSGYGESFRPRQYLVGSVLLAYCITYFGTKAIHTGLAKITVSENLFWSDFNTFTNFLETLPLIMVTICSVTIDIVLRQRAQAKGGDDDHFFFLRSMVAITTPLLWLRVLSFIKNWNKHLATFILCSFEIMKDIKWFLLVLLAAMASFAQMWMTLTYETEEQEMMYEGYMKAYTMMLGDLDTDALRTHPLIAALFVVYTFGVTVVLLNILIAIVSDSYENSFSTSKHMLGKARVMFVSELLSVKTFHDMWMEGKIGTRRGRVNLVFGTVAMCHLWMITGTIIAKLGNTCDSMVRAHEDSLESLGTSASPHNYHRHPFMFLQDGAGEGHLRKVAFYEAYCGSSAISRQKAVQLEAIFVFTVMLFVLYSMKKIVSHVLNEFDDSGRLKSNKEKRSRLVNAANAFVKATFTVLSNSFDSLLDWDDDHALGGEFGESQERSEKVLQRSIEKTRKDLKMELRGQFKQLEMSLREVEENNQVDVLSLQATVATLAESQNQLVEAFAKSNKKSRFGNGKNRRTSDEDMSAISESDDVSQPISASSPKGGKKKSKLSTIVHAKRRSRSKSRAKPVT